MLEILRTDSDNSGFIELVKKLDAALAILDGDDHAFYAQFNKTSKLKWVLVAYENGEAIGCGAIREIGPGVLEIKRMYVVPESRRKGIARQILLALESWASELSYSVCRLETGKRQPEAIALYKKSGYTQIPNYGQYIGMENSVCFEKKIKA